uniref:Uncharacterized protein n=1 Tax=Rhizophora mucronata TaxID=61149 RepID=A0A2P2NS06_RHIMU
MRNEGDFNLVGMVAMLSAYINLVTDR